MRTPRSSSGAAQPHGRLLAGEAGVLAGVSGTTIGQWARWGYIRSSQSQEDPRVYSVEDVAEAAIVAQLIERGVAHTDVHAAIERLGGYGPWPLSEARLATVGEQGRTRIALHEDDEWLVLGPRGWQASAEPRREVAGRSFEEIRLRLRRGP
ncbi:MAG: MerR family transcriptional regulator [Solirubrobacteraceae bacterium]